MSFDLDGLRQAVARHGRVARVAIGAIKGSSPREVGAAMLVWDGGQSGTIGGGALEYRAAQQAFQPGLHHHPLGPELGQCCGGVVTLVHDIHDAETLAALDGDVIARAVDGKPLSLAVKRRLTAARAQGLRPKPELIDGWMIEPVLRPHRQIWIWGAGHVGREIVSVLAPLPDLALTWVDTSVNRFPADIPEGVTVLPASDPGAVVRHAPREAEHYILTYSHALDLDLCHRLLGHGFAFAGLIGSATKWARFRSRLAALGHGPDRIATLTCPIGDPGLGKHPRMIAIGVAAQILRPAEPLNKDMTA